MSKKKRKKKKSREKRIFRQKAAQIPLPPSLNVRDTTRRIEEYLAADNSREALRLAKMLFAEQADSPSEQLVVEAYAARVPRLLASGLVQEAKAMLEIALDNHPDHQASLMDATRAVWARSEQMTRLLSDYGNQTRETQRAIDGALRRWATHPGAVAACRALPTEHPLRSAARAVAEAFEQVTRKPVSEADLQLSEVSRRSPFAPWVPLIRAIAAFYRNDDETARANAHMVSSDSAPYPISQTLVAMIDEQCPDTGGQAAVTLWRKVLARRTGLMALMARTDEALESGQTKLALKQIRKLVTEAQRVIPSIVTSLKQHLSIRCWENSFPTESVVRAMGGASEKSSAYWRLYANFYDRQVKRTPEPDRVLDGGLVWNEFLHHAEAEGLLSGDSLAAAAVYLRMADNIAQLPTFLLDAYRDYVEEHIADGKMNGFATYAIGQPEAIARRLRRDRIGEYILEPKALFQRAAEIYPAKEIFSKWYSWTQQTTTDWREKESVLVSWHARRPADPEPLVKLGNAAFGRGAFKKAMGFVEKARVLDPMNAELNRLHRKALSETAKRHIKQAKTHLAEKDIAALSALLDASDATLESYLNTLRALTTLLTADISAARRYVDEAVSLLDDALVADGLLQILSSQCGIKKKRLTELLPKLPANSSRGRYVDAMARLATLCKRVEIDPSIPDGWSSRLHAEAKGDLSFLGAVTLTAVAEVALHEKEKPLLYAICNSGFELDSSSRARFLWFRGHALPNGCWGHPAVLFHTAACLARRQGDQTLADRATTDARNILQTYSNPFRDVVMSKLQIDISDEGAVAAIKAEQGLPTYPQSCYSDRLEPRYRTAWFDDDEEDDDEDECDCPRCRAARGEYVEPWEFDDDYDDDDDFDDFFDLDYEDEFDERPNFDSSLEKFAERMKRLTGLNADSSPAEFERAARILIDEIGEPPSNVPKAIIPMILEMLVKSRGGKLPFIFDGPKRGSRRRKSRR